MANSFVNDTLTEIAVKRLSGKAQTSTRLTIEGEVIGSTVTVAASTVFGEAVPNDPSGTLFALTTNVEKVRFELSPIPDSFYQATNAETGIGTGVTTYHGYALKLTGSYETNSSNPAAGTGVFQDGFHLSGSRGALQIVPPNQSSLKGDANKYNAKIYSTNGPEISADSSIDWYLDQFAGILFIEDPVNYGTIGSPNVGNLVPYVVEAYIYTGKMVSTRLDEASPSTGGGGHFLATGSAASPVSASLNVGTDDIFKISSGSTDLVTLSTTGGETNFNINGNLVATQYIVSSSVSFFTQSFSSGSTIFGDSLTDTHLFTGSLFITGSQTFTTMSNSQYNEIAYVSKSADGRTELRFSHVIDGGSF
jgi:hypothetical protein